MRVDGCAGLYRPGSYYRNAKVVKRHHDRSWRTFVFEHEPEVVEPVQAAAGMTVDGANPVPRAYHFAYRRTNARDRMWRPYGTVIRFAPKTIFASEGDEYQEDTTDRPLPGTAAETYFGNGAAESSLSFPLKRCCNHRRFDVARRGSGAQGRNRTTDTGIFSAVLYQLSYLGLGVRGL